MMATIPVASKALESNPHDGRTVSFAQLAGEVELPAPAVASRHPAGSAFRVWLAE
jgi:hypothetical protein